MFVHVLTISLAMNLLITLAFELVTALVWGLRNASSLGIVTLVNVCTNPPLSALMVVLWFSALGEQSVWLLLIFEPIIVLIEGYIYSHLLPAVRHPYLFSFVANLASGGLGTLL